MRRRMEDIKEKERGRESESERKSGEEREEEEEKKDKIGPKKKTPTTPSWLLGSPALARCGHTFFPKYHDPLTRSICPGTYNLGLGPSSSANLSRPKPPDASAADTSNTWLKSS